MTISLALMNALKLSPMSSIVLARNNDILYLFTPNDLKNAFCEVDQKLLAEVLKYCKVPHHITLITSLYGDYSISVTTDNYLTSPIKVRHGVLQGDSLSTLLFNLTVNPLIITVNQEKPKCMGYVYDGGAQPKHWMQFADETANVTALESDNQLLSNGFLKWNSWAGLIVTVDKCKCFRDEKE